MSETNFIHLEDLPENGRILIYGSGESAINVLEAIHSGRPDVTVVCFLDSFNEGETAGLKVVKKDDLPNLDGEYDLIVIASAWWRDIIKGLEEMNISQWGVAAEALWHKYVYSNADMARAKSGLDAVEVLMGTDTDKAVYRFMVDARQENSPLVTIDRNNPLIVDYLQIKRSLFGHLTEQYLDFVDRESVKTILHAGVFDGSDCVKFLNAFPNVEAIHGFEPQGEARIAQDTMETLRLSGKVHLHKLGLWNTTETVPLIGTGSYTTLSPGAAAAQITGAIETTSIDEFVAAHAIEKVDYICLDIEGAEARGLDGAQKTIKNHRPQLAICIYHKKEDIFRLPLKLDAMLDEYEFHIGHYYHYLNETVVYAIPKELTQ